MKKLLLWSLPFFVVMPIIGMASPCASYNENYTLQANGASGTLNKVQVMNGNHYSITSTINVSKFFISKTIVQTATGTCDANGNIIAQNFSINKDNNNIIPAVLSNNEFDTLSLVLFLSSTLNTNKPTFSLIPLLYNGTNISVQCVIADSNATVISNSEQTIPATTIVCATSDNSIVLNYSFSQDPTHIMLTANAVENGTTTMSAVIN